MIEGIIKYRRLVLIIWIIGILGMVPLSLHYSNYVNYGNSSTTAASSESQEVQSILSNTSEQNSTLYVLVTSNPFNMTAMNETLSFQDNLFKMNIRNISSVESPYSSYASFIDNTLGKQRSNILSLYNNYSLYSNLILSFPASFMRNYSESKTIISIANESGYNDSYYENLFLYNFNNTPLNLSLESRINDAIYYTVYSYFHSNSSLFYASMVLKYGNISGYPSNLLESEVNFITGLTHFNISKDYLMAATMPGDIGLNYVKNFGLKGVPNFIEQRFINQNKTAFLILITFNVKEGYVSPSGFYPSSAATPIIDEQVHKYFGNNGYLTGNGAIYYETQQQTSKSGAFFGAIYLILFIAVFITLYSYKLSILNLILVSVTVLIGYLAIILSGLIIGKVSYVVTYTLTAVLLGITTDYIVFILYRFRSELRRGNDKDYFLKKPLSNSIRAVTVSGLTVAFSLGMFTFIPTFQTWGTTLMFAILITLFGVVTTSPAILSYLGPKTFLKKGLKKEEEKEITNSYFYKASKFSVTKPLVVVIIIALLAIPSIYVFTEYPTSYNFNAGLPQNLESTQGLSKLDSYFGSNVLYPVYVLVNYSANSINNTYSKLVSITKYLLSLKGTEEVIGPYSSGKNISMNVTAGNFVIDNRYVLYSIFTVYNPYSQNAINYVKNLRENKSLLVGGLTSSIIDQQTQNNRDFTELVILITIAIFLILGISFRSVKYPFISITGVSISILWTISILYFISRFVLHQSVIYLIPVILFVILMSLGNDYSVFIFSRIREEQDKFGKTEGINRGMQTSGKVVTSLGFILAGSLGAIGLVPVGFLEQMGIAFATSLIIDTLIIRTFYFPAMLSLTRANFKD